MEHARSNYRNAQSDCVSRCTSTLCCSRAARRACPCSMQRVMCALPLKAREVFDVTGAGDTVIAVVAAMLACGMSLREALPIANRAAGLVVGKFGTATVSYEELFG